MAKISSTEMIFNLNQTLRLQLYRTQNPTAKVADTSTISHILKWKQGSTEGQPKKGLETAIMAVVVRR